MCNFTVCNKPMLNNKHRVLSTFMSVYAAILFDGHKDQYMVVC